ncbi:MAG TPA: phosphoribosyltransferase family protein [Vitreimonas sp.]|nr:phosphoribosyltransferase family protein [Vitreimonas sp.]
MSAPLLIKELNGSIYSPYSSPDGIYPVKSEAPAKVDAYKYPHAKLRRHIEATDVMAAAQWFAESILPGILIHNPRILYNLKGAEYFYRLLRVFNKELVAEPIRVTTATKEQKQFGEINSDKLQWVDKPVAGRPVLVLDDINDTGRTLAYIVNRLVSEQAQAITTASLYQRKLKTESLYLPTYALLQLPTEGFWVGTGLDDGTDEYRMLTYLYDLLG